MQSIKDAKPARHRWLAQAAAAGLCLALAGCSSTTNGSPAVTKTVTQSPASGVPAAAASSPAAPTPTAAVEMRGNAATNAACKLLSNDQIAAVSGLAVVGMLGLPGTNANGKRSEQCTWYLDPKYVQSSLVVQYTVYATPPADLKAYYAQVIKQGYYKQVPNVGDIAKIDKHVVDAIYRRASIGISLLVHAEATPEDQTASIELMRLVLKGIVQ